MTLAEVAGLVRKQVGEPKRTAFSHGANWALEAMEADPDFNAGPELRALRERLSRLASGFDQMWMNSNMVDTDKVSARDVARRLRECLEGKP